MDEAIVIVNSRYVCLLNVKKRDLLTLNSYSDHPLALYVFTKSSTTYNHSKCIDVLNHHQLILILQLVVLDNCNSGGVLVNDTLMHLVWICHLPPIKRLGIHLPKSHDRRRPRFLLAALAVLEWATTMATSRLMHSPIIALL